MTRTTIMDKERLAAFADGELSPEEAAAVVMHLADHPGDQAYVDEIMAANVALARAFRAPMDEAVPERLARLVLPERSDGQKEPSPNVISFPLLGKGRSRAARMLAAGVAVAAALATVAFLPGGDAGLTVGPVAQASALHGVLSATPSGQVVSLGRAGDVTVLSSLPATEGYCREFEVISPRAGQIQHGLACQVSGGWTVDVLLAESHAGSSEPSDSYVPATGDATGTIDRWLDRRGAGVALTAQEEEALLANGWVR